MSMDVARVVIGISAILYYAAFGLHFPKGKGPGKATWVVWGLAFLGNVSIVISNYAVNGYVPFVSMYQVLTFLALCFAPVFAYMKFLHKGQWMARYFCFASAFCMTGVFFMQGGDVWHFPPALQSIWFVPHILAYMIGYSLCAVAFIIAIIRIFAKEGHSRLDSGIYNLVCTGFPFMTCGMLFGAIWANAVWGAFWSWDLKENWALITWIMYILFLHFRRHKSLKKYANVFVFLGFVAILITLLFVDMIGGESPHTYSMG